MKIAGIGAAVPERCIANTEVERQLGLEAGWALRRTGVRLRPVAAPDEATSDLAVRAGRAALADAGINPHDVALLLLATSTPDHPLPPTAPQVAHRLGLMRAGAVDLAAACAGFVYGLALGEAMGRTMDACVLVIGANVLSRRTDPRDPMTATLFADGAGAAVLVPGKGILGTYLGAHGEHWDEIFIAAGGSREPLTPEAIEAGRHLMQMRNGPELFRRAVRMMAQAGAKALEAAQLDASRVDVWVPHQANRRIIREAGKLLGISMERTVDIVERYGNSSAATIPIALCVARERGLLIRGQIVLLTAVGAGLVSAGAVLRW
ncbi:MAG: 3-oxoacyl-ACP synthase [Chlorobi bacterium NICIL-2]|nr:MAG: 3-oxoacyl-ACP synthase [Chlorobi bacterium NICIL-2]